MKTAQKAFALSFSLHALMALCALWVLESSHSRLSQEPSEHRMILLSLSTLPQPPVQTLSPSAPEETPPLRSTAPAMPVLPTPSKQPVAETPKPLSEPSQKAVAATQPVPTAPQPVSAPLAHSAPAVVEKPTFSAPPPPPPKADNSAEKSAFYTSLRSRIQQQLRYPSAARRRGMEGNVAVRFMLDPGGTIRNVTVSGGESIFHKAAILAVESASGISVPATLQSDFPNTIELVLEFRLRGHS